MTLYISCKKWNLGCRTIMKSDRSVFDKKICLVGRANYQRLIAFERSQLNRISSSRAEYARVESNTFTSSQICSRQVKYVRVEPSE